MDLEFQRGVQLQCLTIYAGVGPARPRPDLESLGGELMPMRAPAPLTECRKSEDPRRFCPRSGGDRDHAECSSVKSSTLRRIECGAQYVGVVRHLNQERAIDLGTTGLGELKVEGILCSAEHLGQ